MNTNDSSSGHDDMKPILTALIAALLYSCAAAGQPQDDEALLIKASALTKVAAAVDSAIRYKDAPVGVPESELLRLATEHDPELLTPFQELKVRVRRSGMNSSVLVCTTDETRGLIEDAGCTARSDEHLWRRQPPTECRFHLDLDAVCNAQ